MMSCAKLSFLFELTKKNQGKIRFCPAFLCILNACAKKMHENLDKKKKCCTFAPAIKGHPFNNIAEWSSW